MESQPQPATETMNLERATLLVAAIALPGIVAFSWHEHNELKALRAAMTKGDDRTLPDGTLVTPGKTETAETVLVAVEHAGFDVGVLKADLSDHGATIRGLLEATKRTEGETRPGLAGNGVLGASSAQGLSIRETIDGRSVPWGSVTFDPAQAKPWTLTQEPRAYTTSVTLAEGEEGGLTAYTRMRIEARGERLDLSPTIAVLRVTPLESRWRWTALPMLTLDAGVRTGVFEWLPGAAVAFASYGQRRDQPEWTFLGLGLAYGIESRRVALSLQPLSYSLRSVLPVLTTSVGPAAVFDADGATYALGVRVLF